MPEYPLTHHENLEDILYPVAKVKGSELFDGYSFPIGGDHVIYLPEQQKVLQMCSEDYHLADNEALIMPVYERLTQTFGRAGITAQVQSYDDRKFYVSFQITEKFLDVAGGADKVCPTVEIRNSYDGTQRQSLAVGYWRQVCSNGMMAFTQQMQVTAKHLTHRRLPIEQVFTYIDDLEVQFDRFRRMTERQLTTAEVKALTEHIRTKTDFPKKLVDQAPVKLYQEARMLGSDPNAWLAYNGFNNVLYHAKTAMHPEQRERIDRQILTSVEAQFSLN